MFDLFFCTTFSWLLPHNCYHIKMLFCNYVLFMKDWLTQLLIFLPTWNGICFCHLPSFVTNLYHLTRSIPGTKCDFIPYMPIEIQGDMHSPVYVLCLPKSVISTSHSVQPWMQEDLQPCTNACWIRKNVVVRSAKIINCRSS